MKLLVIILLLPISIFANDFFNSEEFEFESKLDFYNIPGLSIAIVSDRKISETLVFGEGINDETIFQASALSKPITAFAALKLVEDGLLNLDSNINDYLKSWKLKDTIHTRNTKVTLRMLLSHTSGIDDSVLRGYGKGEELPDIYKLIANVHYFPGMIRRYSWSGYTIIQKMIEDVTGLPYEEYVSVNILKPIGMTRSNFSVPLPESEKNVAVGHDLFGDEIEGGWRNYPELAAMGLWSTPSDMAKYIIEIQNILTGEYEGILSKESVELMLTYQVGGWGLGTSLKFSGEDIIFRHSSESVGYISYFIAKAYKGDAVVFMSSGENSWKIIREIIHSFENYKSWGI